MEMIAAKIKIFSIKLLNHILIKNFTHKIKMITIKRDNTKFNLKFRHRQLTNRVIILFAVLQYYEYLKHLN